MANQPTKYRKFVVGAASAALVASAVAPVASAKDFSDTKGNTHEPAIDALSDAGIITGYPDGSFQPNKTLTRSDVVKLMGKWLVNAQGYEVPSDYKTNPRFADLTSSSNDELLKYAAVVKDNGVFVGTPDGKLDPAGNITRENMAIVLVRAFDRVHDIDLATYVAGQDFKKDVNDRSSAKAEARPAIDVLDFFDITNPAAPAFNPKGTTTRGHFATFLHKSINTDFSDVATGVVGDVAVKAVNATTVEVTFKDAVENVNSLNFTIEGLTVSNAAVKQSDNKTVVLTTAVQEGGKEYVVALNSKEIGKFKGVSAVIPTKIDITTQSVQGKVGAQAIVSADVGVKQAGIPVTFNVKADTLVTLNKDQVFEAVTDENGIATFSYTQYAAGTDEVVAYPTGAPSVRSLGYVFWGVDTILSVEEVTKGETINNGANKTYKVTYKNAKTGKVEANKTFNVSVLENIGVTADKLQDVTINGVKVAQLSNNTRTEAAQITTDSKGEATFTVSGTNAEATPVVFEAFNTRTNGQTSYDYNYEASDLQARASKVKFAAVQAEYTIDVTRDGGEVAATGEDNGREYNIVVKDKAGNLAKNETVNVAFNEDLDRVISTNTKAKFVNPDTDKYYPATGTGNTAKQISVKTNDKGEASFIIATDAGNENDYATPVAWIDINNANAKHGSLDEGEPKTVAPITHFQLPYLDGAKLVAKKNGTGSNTSTFDAADKAVFSAELVNQSNKVFNGGYTIEKVTYTVFNEGADDVIVNGVTISPNRSETFTTNGASLTVESVDQKTTAVRVVATGTAKKDGKDFIFTAKEAKATFTNSKAVAAPYTGYAVEFNTANSGANSNSLWFDGKNPIKYTGTGVKYFGANGNEIFGETAWENYLTSLIGQDVTISYSKDGENTIFKVISVSAGTSKALKAHVATPANNAPVAKEVADQTVAVNGTPLTFTATEVASDADTTDTLKILTAYTSNATVATTSVAGDQLSFTVNPQATGSTTVTVVVSDGKANVNVTFKVDVTPASYTTVIGNPARSFVAAKASTLTLTNPVVTGSGDITISDNATTPNTATVNLVAGASAADIATAINTQAASLVTAVADGDKVVITSKATGVEISSALATATGTALAGTGTNGAAVAAQYTFRVDAVPTSGDVIKVQVGTSFYEYTVTGAEGSTAGLASAIATAVSASNTDAQAFNAKYSVTVSGNVITITQKTAAPTTDTLAVTTR